MAKQRFKFILILLALLIVVSAVYIYFERFAPVTMDGNVRIDAWYVSDDAAWQNLEKFVNEYNEGEGKDAGVTVTLRAFKSETALNNALKSESELPNIVFCDSGTAAVLSTEEKLADIDGYFDSWRRAEFSDKFIDAATIDDELIGLPILGETDVLIVNTKLFKDVDSIETYEQLCALSEEYYKRNDKSFYTVEDYSDFFRLMVLRLGGDFDAVSPHDSDDEDCIHVYNDLLALSALNRGFDTPSQAPAKSVIDGEIACAVVSSSSIARYLDDDDHSIEFLPVPYLKDGDKQAIERLTLLSICASTEEQELASCLFAEWFTSSSVNERFAKGSGYLCADGDSAAGDSAPEKKLAEAVDDIVSDFDTVIYPPDAEYELNSIEFNLNLATLMDGLRNK